MKGYELAISCMDAPASVSVRLNPFKPIEAPSEQRVPWCDYGYMLEKRPQFTLDPLFHCGCYYVQDSSAMFAGHIFRKLMDSCRRSTETLRVLDLCAAPGGKTTDLAASLRLAYGDNFLLVSNEVMSQRASILCDNVAIWGDPNVIVTSVDPKAFASFAGYFDIILADVPCSGEGMFRKDPKAFEEWSPQAVTLCAERQQRIMAAVWPALREGGVVVYSTCTFEQSENDDIVAWMCDELGAEALYASASADGDFEGIEKTELGYLLVPGKVKGEGQYVSAVRKTSPGQYARIKDLSALRPLKNGIIKGEQKGKDFVPNPDYALSIDFLYNDYPVAEVELQTALAFLHRDTIKLEDAPRGYNVISYKGHALGFVKNLGNRCNNLHPQHRRIRMNI